MYCALSGTVPSDPVVSLRTGHLYDRPLIEKALSANGNRCPETGESLTKDDLLSVKTGGTVAPIPPEKSSVPDVLKYISGEWEALKIELHRVKKVLHETRQELATALYRYDSALKVISKLERERDEVRREVSSAGVANGEEKASPALNGGNGDVNETGKSEKADDDVMQLAPGLLARAKVKGEELQAARKARKSSGAPSADKVGTFEETGQVAVDATDARVSSITVGENHAFAGCSSGKLHRLADMKVSHTVDAHKGGVASVWHGDDVVFSGGADGCVRVWDGELQAKAAYEGEGGVVEVEGHPGGTLFCCHEAGFVWRDGESGDVVARGGKGEDMRCAAIHPDGMVFATGGDGVGMWDVASMRRVARLGEGRVTDVRMSEKGYYLVSCDGERAEVWDLRKQLVVGSVELAGAAGVGIDAFGEFGCAVGDEEMALFIAKKRAARVGGAQAAWGKGAGRRGVAWGHGFVLAGGGDGIVRRFEAA